MTINLFQNNFRFPINQKSAYITYFHLINIAMILEGIVLKSNKIDTRQPSIRANSTSSNTNYSSAANAFTFKKICTQQLFYALNFTQQKYNTKKTTSTYNNRLITYRIPINKHENDNK